MKVYKIKTVFDTCFTVNMFNMYTKSISKFEDKITLSILNIDLSCN